MNRDFDPLPYRPRKHILASLSAAVIVAALTLSGCGGSGSGGSGSGSGRAPLNVYVTDGFGDAYKQVLLTLYKIELTSDGTTYQTVFNSAAGQTIDLASMASTAQLLATVTLPAGTYTKARVTFGDQVTLVAKDGTNSSVAVDPSVGAESNGEIAITVNTPTHVTNSQTATLLVDFKLAEFALAGNKLRPSVACGDDTAVGARQRTVHVSGTVSNLVSGTSFVVQGEDGGSVTVDLTPTTTVVSGQTGAAVMLTNGQSVLVEGTYDRSTNTVTAATVTLNDYTTINHARAEGTVANVNSAADSFVLTVEDADGIHPTGGTITIQTTASTVFVQHRHHLLGFSDIAAGNTVEVDGTFDTTSQTLTAHVVMVR